MTNNKYDNAVLVASPVDKVELPKPDNVINLIPKEKTEKDAPKYPDWVETGDGSRPANTSTNLEELSRYLGFKLAFNNLTFEIDVLTMEGKPLGLSFEKIRSNLISHASLSRLPKAAIDDHLTHVCEKNQFHPIRDMLDAGKWDRVQRVDKVIDCLNAADKKLASSVMRAWLVGCVASLYEENFKNKLVPVLQGEQSYMKTAYISRISEIVPNCFLEGAELNPDNKDSILSCIRSWIVELGELERTSKNAQGSLKAFITKSVDTIRPPYARSDIKKKRQTLFIGSVNGHDFLKDETGSSRYGVIEMGEPANMDALNDLLGWDWNNGKLRNVDKNQTLQFWLEVKQLYDNGESWYLSDEVLSAAARANSKFDDKGNWYQAIKESILDTDHTKEWCSASDVCTMLDAGRHYTAPIGKALTRLANEKKVEFKEGRSRSKLYKIPRIKPVIGFAEIR